MGDMADFYNEQVEEMEYDRLRYRTGEISDQEAYDLGIIDEVGYEANAWTGRKSESKICRSCGIGGLTWGMTPKGKWLLKDSSGKLHNCSKNPYNKDFKKNK